LVNDFIDPTVSTGQAALNLGTNLAWGLAGAIPDVKIGKTIHRIIKYLPIIITAANVYGMATSPSLQKTLGKFSEAAKTGDISKITYEDIKNLSWMSGAANGGT